MIKENIQENIKIPLLKDYLLSFIDVKERDENFPLSLLLEVRQHIENDEDVERNIKKERLLMSMIEEELFLFVEMKNLMRGRIGNNASDFALVKEAFIEMLNS